jgi:hypothetical protein
MRNGKRKINSILIPPTMNPISRILSLMIQAMIPIFSYELGTIGFWLLTYPVTNLDQVHHLAWRQDLPYLLALFSILYFVAGIWYYFIKRDAQTGSNRDKEQQ